MTLGANGIWLRTLRAGGTFALALFFFFAASHAPRKPKKILLFFFLVKKKDIEIPQAPYLLARERYDLFPRFIRKE